MVDQKFSKLIAALIILVVLGIMEMFNIKDNYQADAAQRAQHECKSDTPKCDPNAFCFGNDTSYECLCISGWDGDGFVGDGHSRCQRRQQSKSQQAILIIAFILVALLVLWFLVDAILGCIRLRARIRNNVQVGLAPQAYPHQGVVPGRVAPGRVALGRVAPGRVAPGRVEGV